VLLGLEARPEEEKKGVWQPYPEAIHAIRLFLNESLACNAVQFNTLQNVTRWESKTRPLTKLAEWLLRLHPSRLYQYSLSVRGLAALQRLSLFLLR